MKLGCPASCLMAGSGGPLIKGAEEHRIYDGQLYVSLGPCGASDFLRKSAIIRRLWRHLLPKEEGFCTTSCTRGDTKGILVTLTSKSGCEKM